MIWFHRTRNPQNTQNTQNVVNPNMTIDFETGSIENMYHESLSMISMNTRSPNKGMNDNNDSNDFGERLSDLESLMKGMTLCRRHSVLLNVNEKRQICVKCS